MSGAKSSGGHRHSFEQQNKIGHLRVKGIRPDPGIGGVTLTTSFRVVATEQIPALATGSSLLLWHKPLTWVWRKLGGGIKP